ncbi:MAG: response regulator transcription factor [Microbacterium sp.]
MRVVIADDVMLVRSGVSLLLTGAGIDVVGEAADAASLLRLVDAQRPDVAIIDIRMPPTHTDEGLVAAGRVRDRYAGTGVILLSQHVELRYAERLLTEQPGSVGYLLKERVSDIAILVDALERISVGECVIDPSIVAQLMRRRRSSTPLDGLSERERQVLTAMAEGRSNAGIARELFISERTVESMCAQIFHKLELAVSPDDNRRVLAVLAALRT